MIDKTGHALFALDTAIADLQAIPADELTGNSELLRSAVDRLARIAIQVEWAEHAGRE